jgi:hypothetical protein
VGPGPVAVRAAEAPRVLPVELAGERKRTVERPVRTDREQGDLARPAARPRDSEIDACLHDPDSELRDPSGRDRP